MAKLYFYYASMNAGKSTTLLQAAFNYRERGMRVSLWTAAIDDRPGFGAISSRIGLSSDAHRFAPDTDILEHVIEEHSHGRVDCVLIDEAQFLTEEQVWQLAAIADDLGIPVMCYGLRTDFQGKLFPGSAALLSIADDLREIRTICWCGKKATMVVRLGADGQPLDDGDQVDIGGNDKYISLCRHHWKTRKLRDD